MNTSHKNFNGKSGRSSVRRALGRGWQLFILLALIISTIGPGTVPVRAADNWTAYNDCVYDSGQDSYIGANVTTFGVGSGFEGETSGELIDQATGDLTGVTATLTESGGVNWQPEAETGGADTAAGTDANNTFGGITDMTGVIYYGDLDWYVDLTISGLDPAMQYTFATSSSRNNDSYTDRYTIYSLSGVDAALNASTAGVNEIDNLTVWFNTGDNHDEGYVARWTGIQPGADGTFTVRAEAHPDSNDGGRKAYAFDVFMLHEESGEPPVQHMLTATDDGNGSVTLAPAGGVYNENSTVTLTPVPSTGFTFDSWSGPDAGDLIDNGDGTWSILMDADKEVSASFMAASEVTLTFQEGVGGYAGTVDTHIMEDAPDEGHGSLETVEWDADDPQGTDQYKYALIRFEDIFGSDPGQIPAGAAIQSAALYYIVDNEGDPAEVHEAAVDWEETETWDSFGGEAGVQTDEYGDFVADATGSSTGSYSIDVTDSLAAWTNSPASNRGWIFLPTGSDGVDIFSSEYGTAADRPSLSVTYLTGPVNQPPDQPTLVQPADAAAGVSTSPVLEVRVTDPEEDPMDVSFYGRQIDGSAEPGEDFTLIALPDTQMYAQSYPDIFTGQTAWIVDQIDALNIVYVAHEGDIVNTASSTTQWDNADAAMSLLEDPITTGLADGIPYGVVPGNHDTPTTYYNDYFGADRFEGRGYYGGHYSTTNDNNYTLFSAGGMDFIVVNLEYQPGTAELDWADARLKEYSDRRGIVVSHSMLNTDDSWSYQAIYDALKDNPNLFLMLCGHMHTPSDGAAQRTETGDFGNTIYVLLADYQDYTNGGDGYLRIMQFSPANDTISVETYSPYQDANLTDAQNEFALAYDMEGAGPSFELLGTVSGVSSGGNADITWSGLDQDTEYEWYAVAADAAGDAASATWSFTTGDSNSAPVAVDDQYSTSVDTQLDIPAVSGVLANDDDPDEDTLTAINASDPPNGTLTLNSDGSFVYLPDAGFIGMDSFTYQAFDGALPSAQATVEIEISSGSVPPMPSSFYGEVHVLDNPPAAGDLVEAYVPGAASPVSTVGITESSGGTLNYSFNVLGDIPNTPEKEGGVEGDPITFMINGRIVAIGEWHSGPNVELNFHPPQAVPGGPYSGGEGAVFTFSGGANDWGGDAGVFEWDWDNDGIYDESGQNPSHTWADAGVYTIGLKVTDAQGGEGTATVDATVTQPPEFDVLLGRPTDQSITINVLPDQDVAFYFEYGTASGSYTDQTSTYTSPAAEPHESVIDGLAANTEYFYRMVYRKTGETAWLEGDEYSFFTQRAPGSTFSFTIVSDSHLGQYGGNTADAQALYNLTLANIDAENPDFHIDLGDSFPMDPSPLGTGMTEEEAETAYLTQRPYIDQIANSAPVFWALGNHENEEGWNFDDEFTPPDQSLALVGMKYRKLYYPNPVPDDFYTGNEDDSLIVGDDHFREDYYAWEWGDALFVILDPYQYSMVLPDDGAGYGGEGTDETVTGDSWEWTLGDAQYQWLKTTLENSTATHKFVFSHHETGGMSYYARGGAEAAQYYEWGGRNWDGVWEFDEKRPGWDVPIHQLMVDNDVTIFFHGHDHFFGKEDIDGMVYQEVPKPDDESYGMEYYESDDYPNADILTNSGHILVTVTGDDVTVDYVRSYLPGDGTNGEVAYSYTMVPTYDLSVSVDPAEGGTTEPAVGMHYLPQGDVVDISAAPNAGYLFDHWEGDVADPDSADTTITLDENKSITAHFTIQSFSLEYAAGPNGSLTGETSQTVDYGQDGIAVEAVPNTGYHFVDWSDGVTDNPRADTDVTGDIDVTANFAITTFTLAYAAGPGGTLTGETSQTVNYGEDGTAVEAIPDPDFEFTGWSDGVMDNPRTDTGVLADVDVTANFARPTTEHSIALEAGWNLVSFNLEPVDPDIAAVLSSIDGTYDLVYAWDASGGHSGGGNWMKYAPLAPGYQNTLTNLDETMGFWIHTLAADTLVVTGYEPESPSISLMTAAGGWNLVGYPSALTQPLPDVLSDHGVGDNFTLIYVYHANDTADPWKLFDRTAADWANELTEMDPGWGYWIFVTSDSSWGVE